MSLHFRPHQLADAQRFYEILNNPNFTWMRIAPASVEAELEWLKGSIERHQTGIEYNYSLIYKGDIIGSAGIKRDYHRRYIGEIGYFVDEAYWNMGFASLMVAWLEALAWQELGFKRLQIVMHPDNLASEKVALKNGYLREGLLRQYAPGANGLEDCWLYAKLKPH